MLKNENTEKKKKKKEIGLFKMAQKNIFIYKVRFFGKRMKKSYVNFFFLNFRFEIVSGHRVKNVNFLFVKNFLNFRFGIVPSSPTFH